MLTGDDGILTKAQTAKTETEKASEEEQEQLADLENTIEGEEIGIRKVVDEKPGELEESKTEQNTFIINSIEDLVAFASDVTNGYDDYEGKIVKLGLNLDFKSDKSYVNANRTDYEKYGYSGNLKDLLTTGTGFIPIGSSSNQNDNQNYFKGTFEGESHKIYNLRIEQKIDTESCRIEGMFTVNRGIIENLGIEKCNVSYDNSTGTWSAYGVLAGVNESAGIIRNCYVTGQMKCAYKGTYNVGCLIGSNQGVISECYNKADLYVARNEIISSMENIRIGGIIGAQDGYENIGNLYNTGSITFSNLTGVEISSEINIGSICGVISQKGVIVFNSYATGPILGNGRKDWVYAGNIFGRGTGNTSNCYCLGDLTSDFDSKNRSSVKNLCTPKTEEEMKKEDFVKSLNDGQEEIWKKDTKNVNKGFPILSWQ